MFSKKTLFCSMYILTNQLSQAEILNQNNPEKYGKFCLDLIEMQEIANPNKLSWRVFYEKPSQGPNATWFDAVKQGNLAKVKQMLQAGQNIEATDDAVL